MSDTNLLPTSVSAHGNLPATYEAARKALAECTRVDECKTWADKAAALASYARQAKDDSLRVMASRIQARAERRAGELLKQIPSAQGERTDKLQVGTAPKLTRTSAAEAAGLSERQRKTALRMANVPEREFERALASESPPTVTDLAELGKATRPTPASAQEARQLAEAHGRLRDFAAFCSTADPIHLASGVTDADLVRGYIATIDAWLDRLVTRLSG